MKKKIMVGIVLLLIIGLSGCIDTEKTEYWTWELSAGERVNVTFTDQMIDCTGSNKTEELFASIITKVDMIFQTQDGVLKSWSYARHIQDLPQTLNDIWGDVPLSVSVSENCVLTIERC